MCASLNSHCAQLRNKTKSAHRKVVIWVAAHRGSNHMMWCVRTYSWIAAKLFAAGLLVGVSLLQRSYLPNQNYGSGPDHFQAFQTTAIGSARINLFYVVCTKFARVISCCSVCGLGCRRFPRRRKRAKYLEWRSRIDSETCSRVLSFSHQRRMGTK